MNYTPLPILIRALLLGMAMLMSNPVMAENSFLINPNFNDLRDGDVMLAPLGRRGAGFRLTFSSPALDPAAVSRMASNGMWQINEGESEVFFAFVIPW